MFSKSRCIVCLEIKLPACLSPALFVSITFFRHTAPFLVRDRYLHVYIDGSCSDLLSMKCHLRVVAGIYTFSKLLVTLMALCHKLSKSQ